MGKKSDKPINCTKCDRIISRPDHLSEHLKAHVNFRHKCLACNMRYSFQKYLNEHQTKTGHKGSEILNKSSLKSTAKPTSIPPSKPKIPQNPPTNPKKSLKCCKCSYSALSYGHLKRHLISHQYWFHKCRAVGCGISFRTLKLLNEHRTETGHSDDISSIKVNENDSKLKSTSDERPQQHKIHTENDTSSSNSINKDKSKNDIKSSEIRHDNKNFRLLIQQIEEQALKHSKKKKKIESSSSSNSSYFSAFESENDDKLEPEIILKVDAEKAKKYEMKKERNKEKYKAQRKASNEMIFIRKFRGKLNFQCRKCGKSFGKIGSARTHVDIHINSNLECPKCKRILRSKRWLTIHMRAHNRLKFICSIGSCGMKFASIQCIKNHHVKDHGVEPSDESGTEDDDVDDKPKESKILTRSMSQVMDLKNHRGKISSPLPDSSPSSSSTSSRSNSPVQTTNSSTNRFIPSSFVKQLSTLSISKMESEDLETSIVSTSVDVLEIKDLNNNLEKVKNCSVKKRKRNKNKNEFKLECLMCSKKFENSFMLWGHLFKKH